MWEFSIILLVCTYIWCHAFVCLLLNFIFWNLTASQNPALSTFRQKCNVRWTLQQFQHVIQLNPETWNYASGSSVTFYFRSALFLIQIITSFEPLGLWKNSAIYSAHVTQNTQNNSIISSTILWMAMSSIILPIQWWRVSPIVPMTVNT